MLGFGCRASEEAQTSAKVSLVLTKGTLPGTEQARRQDALSRVLFMESAAIMAHLGDRGDMWNLRALSEEHMGATSA